MIKFRIEDNTGDTEVQVPLSNVPEKVNELIKDEKWCSIEHKDGTTETITKKINPEEFKKTLEEVKSVTATSKLRGG